MAKDPRVNHYRSGKNPERHVILFKDEETGELTVHVADLARGFIKTFRDSNGKDLRPAQER